MSLKPLWLLLLLAVPAHAEDAAPTPAETVALRPSPAALRALCADAFTGIARQETAPTPVAILPAKADDPLADFVVDYLHWCLGTERGVALVERARLNVLLRELQTQRMLGASDITARVAALAGGRSVLVVAVHPVDPQTRDLTTRLTALDGGAVLHATAPVRVEHKGLLELQREMVARGSRLVAAGLSAALPGAGQYYNDQPIKGAIVLAVELGLVAAAVGYHVAGVSEEDAYHGNRAEDVAHGDRAEAAYTKRNLLLWGALGVWALQVIDAAVFGGVPADVEQRYQERIGVGAGPGGVGASLGVRF